MCCQVSTTPPQFHTHGRRESPSWGTGLTDLNRSTLPHRTGPAPAPQFFSHPRDGSRRSRFRYKNDAKTLQKTPDFPARRAPGPPPPPNPTARALSTENNLRRRRCCCCCLRFRLAPSPSPPPPTSSTRRSGGD